MPKISNCSRHLPENVVRRALPLACRVNYELSIVPKPLQ